MALKHGQKLADLQSLHTQQGRLRWIGIRPTHRATLETAKSIELITNHGLSGDHRALKKGSRRQVTLLQFEYLDVIAHLMGKKQIQPELLRRNLLISGINLYTLRKQTFSIGSTILEGTGHCHPCSRMEDNLGEGGYNAVRGHGGITARILQGGIITLGDSVKWLEES